MSEFSKELNKLSPDEMVAKVRTDADFVSNAYSFVAKTHPEIFTDPEEVLSEEEVASKLGVELPESNK
jgi:hypothetical protein